MSAARSCPVCGNDACDRATAPFCGERCRTIDLGRWLEGAYRLPATEQPAAPPRSGDDEDSSDADSP
ncbi:MAG: DNA gyrase inhibitor YacG [Nitrospirae bacterium]|nr:DNA gyrase inhibitor YacG [Nitrospirota bacterium]